MPRIEKTVFISYRHSNAGWATAIYQYLMTHGYDVFKDFENIGSGDFERVILESIRARAHFLIVLTPTALEHCGNPEDWLRREIEAAIMHRRNIVPVMFDKFDFTTPAISRQLTGSLAALKRYQALSVPSEFFAEAMERLCGERFLSKSLDAVLHPISDYGHEVAMKEQARANRAPAVPKGALEAEVWFEQGFSTSDLDQQIRCYSEAILLDPRHSEAFYRRGIARALKQDRDGAVEDYSHAIELEHGNHYMARVSRGEALKERAIDQYNLEDIDTAIRDYEEAVRIGGPKRDYNYGLNISTHYRLMKKVTVARELRQSLFGNPPLDT